LFITMQPMLRWGHKAIDKFVCNHLGTPCTTSHGLFLHILDAVMHFLTYSAHNQDGKRRCYVAINVDVTCSMFVAFFTQKSLLGSASDDMFYSQRGRQLRGPLCLKLRSIIIAVSVSSRGSVGRPRVQVGSKNAFRS
jgi:hypothetical protein